LILVDNVDHTLDPNARDGAGDEKFTGARLDKGRDFVHVPHNQRLSGLADLVGIFDFGKLSVGALFLPELPKQSHYTSRGQVFVRFDLLAEIFGQCGMHGFS
jgi:hypothetical protein